MDHERIINSGLTREQDEGLALLINSRSKSYESRMPRPYRDINFEGVKTGCVNSGERVDGSVGFGFYELSNPLNTLQNDFAIHNNNFQVAILRKSYIGKLQLRRRNVAK